jgi:hypothetical protein
MELSRITPTLNNTVFKAADKAGSSVVGSITYSAGRSAQSAGGNKSQAGIEDTVTLSPEAKEKASRADTASGPQKTTANSESASLDQQELAQLQQLKRRDTEVRAHEQAHLAAAGQYARGGASFTYQKGPDGASYAIGGEVGIDVAKESTPEATITKMQTIKRAALAPATPSGADKRIAAQAGAKEAQARQEMLQVRQEELLRGEEGTFSLAGSEVAGNSVKPDKSEIIASPHGSLKTKLAAYEKMAAQ